MIGVHWTENGYQRFYDTEEAKTFAQEKSREVSGEVWVTEGNFTTKTPGRRVARYKEGAAV